MLFLESTHFIAYAQTAIENKEQSYKEFGATFPILEEHMISWLTKKLHDIKGEFSRHHSLIQKHIYSQVIKPPKVKNILQTKIPRTFTYDPTLILTNDITLPNGNIIYRSGTRLNPLRQTPLTKDLLFADGDYHYNWIQREIQRCPNAVIILVGGSPLHLEAKLNQPVYFDQGGILCHKLGIQNVPARVTQKGYQLHIEEVTP